MPVTHHLCYRSSHKFLFLDDIAIYLAGRLVVRRLLAIISLFVYLQSIKLYSLWRFSHVGENQLKISTECALFIAVFTICEESLKGLEYIESTVILQLVLFTWNVPGITCLKVLIMNPLFHHCSAMFFFFHVKSLIIAVFH